MIMQVRIYQMSKPPTQSGSSSKLWIVDFFASTQMHKFVDRTLGWIGTQDPQAATKIYFTNLENAIRFCQDNFLDYDVIPPKHRKIVAKTYADTIKLR